MEVFIAVGATAVMFFCVGYAFGYSAGCREGMARERFQNNLRRADEAMSQQTIDAMREE